MWENEDIEKTATFGVSNSGEHKIQKQPLRGVSQK